MRKPSLLISAVIVAALFGFAFAQPENGTSPPPIPDASAVEVRVPEQERDVNEAAQVSPLFVYGPLREDGSRDATWRHQAVGKKVRVEGIAWGQPWGADGEKGTVSPHAGPKVLYEGGAVFVRRVDLAAKDARGKAVRVVGTLRLEPESRTAWGDVEKWYYIEPASFEVIERVSDPVLVLIPGDP
jgi:hypothetical protein